MDVYKYQPAEHPRVNNTITYANITEHPELFYNGADVGFMIAASALVLLMIPGVALYYSGASHKEWTMTVVRAPLIAAAATGWIWFFWGYTLAFSEGSLWFGGDIGTLCFRKLSVHPVGFENDLEGVITGRQIPELVYALYQGAFASFTACLISGSIGGHALIGRFLAFLWLWVPLVYCPMARWTWHSSGWSRTRGSMDFAGGTAVHICAGVTVAAYSVFLQLERTSWRVWNHSRATSTTEPSVEAPLEPATLENSDSTGANNRSADAAITGGGDTSGANGDASASGNISGVNRGQSAPQPAEDPAEPAPGATESGDPHWQRAGKRPHSITHLVIGTALMWVGWFGFNGGSALGANLRAVSACLSTHFAACTGGIMTLLVSWFIANWRRLSAVERKPWTPSAQEFCEGVIAGLIAITPAAGYVPVSSSPAFGIVGGLVCYFLRHTVSRKFLPADYLCICAVHAGSGFVGMILTAFLASDEVTHLDGYSTLVDGTTGARLRDQFLDVFAGLFYAFVVTFLILLVLKAIRWVVQVFIPDESEQRRFDINDRWEAAHEYKESSHRSWE